MVWSLFVELRILVVKNSTYEQQLFFFDGQHSSNIFENRSLASIQFSGLMQYFTLGGSMVPCIRPASFSSLRCCDTVAFAMGSTSCMSPKKHSFLWARKCRMAMRVGCPIAFANLARRSCSGVISNFVISILISVRKITNNIWLCQIFIACFIINVDDRNAHSNISQKIAIYTNMLLRVNTLLITCCGRDYFRYSSKNFSISAKGMMSFRS